MSSSRQNDLRPLSPSQAWETSVAGENIVAKFLPDYKEPIFRTLSFIPKAVCTVLINNEQKLVLNPALGLEMNTRFQYIYDFQILEGGIEYYFLAGY